MGNKLLYAMEHADRIFAGFVLSNNWKDLLAGIVVAVVLKVLVWQKQSLISFLSMPHARSVSEEPVYPLIPVTSTL